MMKEADPHDRHGASRAALVLVVIAGLTTLLGLAALFWWSGPSRPALKADPDNVRQVALGREIYARRCASCHGKQLEGQPNWRVRKADGRLPAPPHDATGHTWHHADGQLFELTKYGPTPIAPLNFPSDMPAFGSVLTDEEIWAALAFIKSFWPKRIRERQLRMAEESSDEQ